MAHIDWNDGSKWGGISTTKEVQAIYCSIHNTTMILTINSTIAIVNGKKVDLNIPPQIKNKATVVPLRFVVEALNCDLKWDNGSKSIKIIFPRQDL